MHRRDFLATSLVSPAALVGFFAHATAIDPIPRQGGPLLKLSLAAYSFRDHLTGKKQPAMTFEDFVDLAATLGLPAVEPTSYYFKDTSPAYLTKLKGRCIRLGLDVSGGAVGNKFTE